jgi:lipoprotein-anchoring transpeptidase ErfK/SrfK
LREARVETRRSPYEVRVHLGSRTLELLYEGGQVGTWTVAIGEPGTPTPTGRTFVLGSVVDEAQSFSPVILPLGSHSDTLDTYGGGPGTVALHGWPDASVFGSAVSHGCIRVPADALDRLRQVPLGTLVRVDEQ